MKNLQQLVQIHEAILQSENVSPDTIRWYRGVLGAFCKWLDERPANETFPYTGDPEQLNPFILREYMKFLIEVPRTDVRVKGRSKMLSDNSVLNHYRALRGFANRLHTEKLLPENFMDRVKPPKVEQAEKKIISSDEFLRLLEAARLGTNGLRDEALLLLLLDTGLRREEARTLKKDQLDGYGVSISVLGKGRRRRTVAMSGTTTLALARYMASRSHFDSEYVFLTETGEQLTKNGLYQIIRRLGQRAAVEVHPHAFRHTMATAMLMSGASTLVVQNLLGHSKSDITNNYMHMANADAISLHQKFSPVTRLTQRS